MVAAIWTSHAAETVILDGKEFRYDTADRLRQKCQEIAARYDREIADKEKAAKSPLNPFREKAAERAKELRQRRTVFLQTAVVCPASVIVCSACKELCKVGCRVCNGTGKVNCSKCDGTGKGRGLRDWGNCNKCAGKKRFECSTCNSSGRVNCDNCGGTGRVCREAYKTTVGQLLGVK
jgi:hypothetical protein